MRFVQRDHAIAAFSKLGKQVGVDITCAKFESDSQEMLFIRQGFDAKSTRFTCFSFVS